MLKFFKKNKKKEKTIQLLDINGNPIEPGDEVEAQRYELGKSKLIVVEGQFHYESLETGKKVHWAKMIDAVTQRQKVKKSANKE
ncbi:MAG: hypothetical protein ACEPO8_08170 [Rhodothermaceae bacterium]